MHEKIKSNKTKQTKTNKRNEKSRETILCKWQKCGQVPFSCSHSLIFGDGEMIIVLHNLIRNDQMAAS